MLLLFYLLLIIYFVSFSIYLYLFLSLYCSHSKMSPSGAFRIILFYCIQGLYAFHLYLQGSSCKSVMTTKYIYYIYNKKNWGYKSNLKAYLSKQHTYSMPLIPNSPSIAYSSHLVAVTQNITDYQPQTQFCPPVGVSG